ncbi:MAG: hypothetical protein AAF125_00375 [Chloroflexota bacterium]
MATNNVSTRINPEALGQNHRQLALWAISALIAAGMIIAAMWYSYYWNPYNNILGAETAQPLREQVPLAIMPRLPDALEDAYDAYTTGEITLLSESSDADGEARIPVEDAQANLLEQGMFQVREGAPAAPAGLELDYGIGNVAYLEDAP